MQKIYYLFITFFLLLHATFAQENPSKKIEIVYAGTLTIDNDKYPGATIFNSDQERKVQFRHQGMDIWCDVAVLYQKTNQVKAFGEVFIQQGDSLKMNSEFIEYNGDTKVAIAKENVKLRNEKMTLETQELFFDRNTQQAYYLNYGKIFDEENVLTSKEGRYFVGPKEKSIHHTSENHQFRLCGKLAYLGLLPCYRTYLYVWTYHHHWKRIHSLW